VILSFQGPLAAARGRGYTIAMPANKKVLAAALALALAAPAALVGLSPALRQRAAALWTSWGSAPVAQAPPAGAAAAAPAPAAAPVSVSLPGATFAKGALGDDETLAPVAGTPVGLGEPPKLEPFTVPQDETGPPIGPGVSLTPGGGGAGCVHSHARIDLRSRQAGYSGAAPEYDPCPVGGYNGKTAGYDGAAPGYGGKTAGYDDARTPAYGAAPMYGAAPQYGKSVGYAGRQAGYGQKAAGYSDKGAGY